MINQQKTRVQEELWIDYMEGEMSESFRRDLEIIHDLSNEDHEVLQTYKQIKKSVSESQTQLPVKTKSYYDQLQDKIMIEIRNKNRELFLGDNNFIKSKHKSE